MKQPRPGKRYMTDQEFGELMDSLNEALAHAKAEPNECRETRLEVPAPPKRRNRRDIAMLRRRLNYSQPMFARALNVSVKTVRAWEQGTRRPGEAALKLLAIADKHPEALIDSV